MSPGMGSIPERTRAEKKGSHGSTDGWEIQLTTRINGTGQTIRSRNATKGTLGDLSEATENEKEETGQTWPFSLMLNNSAEFAVSKYFAEFLLTLCCQKFNFTDFKYLKFVKILAKCSPVPLALPPRHLPTKYCTTTSSSY